jgi:Fe-S-cluster-containing hydrogenase component 2
MSSRRKSCKSSCTDIFQILTETKENEKRKRKEQLLAPLNIEEFFAEGSISINKRTCRGVECKLCLKACPTSALYWRAGEVGIEEDLCIYCGACVLCCIVDDCIKIKRKRADGEIEAFSKPKDFVTLQNGINTRKRIKTIVDLFSEAQKEAQMGKKNQKEQKMR